ncbi:unnamed protein product, partial [Discosporangium mesarthrocarpum]
MDSSYVKGSALYLLLYGSMGSIMPFLSLVWIGKGLSKHEVGVVGAITRIVTFVATPQLCAIADRHNARREVRMCVERAWFSYPGPAHHKYPSSCCSLWISSKNPSYVTRRG